MNPLTIVKKIGEKVLSVIEWPFKHAAMLEHLIADGLKNEPAVKDVIIGLAQRFETLGPDVVADIAARGLNIAADVQTVADLKALFSYFAADFLPTVESAYKELSKDAGIAAIKPIGEPAQPAADTIPAQSEPQSGPGLHAITPA